MDSIVTQLTEAKQNGRVLVCIGSSVFNPSAPIKKYRRCPGRRKIIKLLKKIRDCDIVFVDEYNTSQVCGKCHAKLEKVKHELWSLKEIRHRVCDDCHPTSNIINLPKTIVSPKS